MPRSGRGGTRSGKVGQSYANRTDLNSPKAAPITTVPGQAYGQAKAQADAQRIVPMANAPITSGAGAPPTPPGGSPAAPGTPPPGAAGPSLGDFANGALPPGVPAPGSLPSLTAPTDRPDEHMMTGVPSGPGAGPEALTPLISQPLMSGVAQLNTLGSSLSPQLKAIRDAVQAQLANQATP